MNRRDFIKTVGTSAAATLASPGAFAQRAKRPNILWLSTEDIGPMHGCYGDTVAVTPFIDRLASEGVRYTNAYTCSGVCAPSRYGIITGRYPTSDGTQHLRSGIGQGFGELDYYSRLPEGVRFFTSYLREAGYYCTNNAKEDYQVDTPADAWDESSGTAHWRNRPDPAQPFFHVVNFFVTHESQVMRPGPPRRRGGEDPNVHELTILNREQLPESRRTDPAKVVVPPYFPDTPDVRKMIAQNYDNVSTMDTMAEAVVAQLEKDELADDTIIVYWSDHAGPLARGKRYVYDSGIHVPLIARIPEKFRARGQGAPGSVDDRLVSFLDLGPTMLNLAGLPVPANVQGRPFLGRNRDGERDYVYAARDRMDERYDTVRAVRDKRFKYIKNYQQHKPTYQYIDFAERGIIQKEIRRVEAEGALPDGVAGLLSASRPPEELYDTHADPHEVNNLAGAPEHAATLARLRQAHNAWMVDTRDTGLLPEPIMIEEQGDGSANTILQGDPGLERLNRLLKMVDAANSGRWTELTHALKDGDAAVRYWAAVGLGAGSGPVSGGLEDAMEDRSACVRVAAAQSVVRLGNRDAARASLLKSLNDDSHWIRLMAALAIDEDDTMAALSLEEIRPYRADESKYVSRVVNRTLNRLEGTSESVR